MRQFFRPPRCHVCNQTLAYECILALAPMLSGGMKSSLSVRPVNTESASSTWLLSSSSSSPQSLSNSVRDLRTRVCDHAFRMMLRRDASLHECPRAGCTGVAVCDGTDQTLPAISDWATSSAVLVASSASTSSSFGSSMSASTVAYVYRAPRAIVCPIPHCAHTFCAACKEGWHPFASCAHAKAEAARGLGSAVAAAFSDTVRACPQCLIPIERAGGCSRVQVCTHFS